VRDGVVSRDWTLDLTAQALESDFMRRFRN
jgi:hypothetical protein